MWESRLFRHSRGNHLFISYAELRDLLFPNSPSRHHIAAPLYQLSGREEEKANLERCYESKEQNVYDVMTKTHEINVFFFFLYFRAVYIRNCFILSRFFKQFFKEGTRIKKKREVKAKPPLSVSTQKG